MAAISFSMPIMIGSFALKIQAAHERWSQFAGTTCSVKLSSIVKICWRKRTSLIAPAPQKVRILQYVI